MVKVKEVKVQELKFRRLKFRRLNFRRLRFRRLKFRRLKISWLKLRKLNFRRLMIIFKNTLGWVFLPTGGHFQGHDHNTTVLGTTFIHFLIFMCHYVKTPIGKPEQ